MEKVFMISQFLWEDILKEAERHGIPITKKRAVLREFLQVKFLTTLYHFPLCQNLSFIGGTSLRLLRGLDRFSEDLDFSLDSSNGYDPAKWMNKTKHDLQFAGLDVIVTLNDNKTVHVAWIKVGEVLKNVGLAAMTNQKLSIKLEIDTRPPAGAQTLNRVIERHRMFAVRCYDMPSLMAGKLHALITRRYCKGRDWYDFIWYRAQRPQPEPNLVLLQNALDQTEGKGSFQSDKWKDLVRDKIKNWTSIKYSKTFVHSWKSKERLI